MSMKLVPLVWDLVLSQPESQVLICLCDSANHVEGKPGLGISCYVSLTTIAWRTNLTRRGVQRILKRLEKSGLVVFVKKGVGRLVTEYEIHLEKGVLKRPPSYRREMTQGHLSKAPEMTEGHLSKAPEMTEGHHPLVREMTLTPNASLFMTLRREGEGEDLPNTPQRPLVFSEVMEKLEKGIDPQHFDTWYRQLSVARINAREVVLLVPSQFHADYLQEHVDTLQNALLPDRRKVVIELSPKGRNL